VFILTKTSLNITRENKKLVSKEETDKILEPVSPIFLPNKLHIKKLIKGKIIIK
jgi:hypothetical protein